jgi:hypothetical protein
MTDGADERIVRLRRAYVLFDERRIDEALALMTEDVAWPDVANGVVLHGRDAVRPYWTAQFAVASPVVVPERFIDLGRDIVAVVRQRVDDLDGQPIIPEHLVYHRYEFDGDLVCRMTVHEGEADASAPR